MNEQHSSILLALAGTCIFIFGMSIASENLQKLAANRIRDLIAVLSKTPFYGVILGIGLTLMVQSSGAVTSMLVGLGSAGVISLQQVMSVILGTTIGTTFTVQLLSFNVAKYGMGLFALSFPVYFLTKRRVLRTTMAVFMGFGLIFWGLDMISQGTESLKHVEMFVGVLDYLKSNPVMSVVLAAFFTAVVQSSAVTIGFAMSLAGSGTMSLYDAIFIVLGANIGTTATALIAASGGNYVGRQVAWAHCLYKMASMIMFLPFVSLMADYMPGGGVEREIANVHTFINIFAAILFFPIIRYGAQFVEKTFPPSPSEKEFSVKYLRRGDWESISVAMAHAEREVLRMADIVLDMINKSLDMFRDDDPDLEKGIRSRDDRVDLLNREISMFLTQHMEGATGDSLAHMVRLITFVSDLEAAADVIDNNMLDLAKKKHMLKVEFSKDGWKDLEELHAAVTHVASLSISCFQRQDKDLAAKVVFHKRNIRKIEKRMRESHIERLVQRRQESINTSSIHLDVLGEYRRIVGLLSNHAYGYLKETDKYNLLPRRED